MKYNWGPIMTVVVIGLFSIYDVESSFNVWTPYQKKMDLLKKVMRQDHHWNFIYDQAVYVPLDRKYYGHIIETELLDSTLDHFKHDREGVNRPACAAGDPIMPENFLDKLFQGRHVISSLLDMGLQVLQKSMKCLMYKDLIHILTIIINEITQNLFQKDRIKYSKKTRILVVDMVILMSGLQYTDDLLLRVIKFLSIFIKEDPNQALNRFKVTPYLGNIIAEMLDYLPCNCIKAPTSAAEVAIELGLNNETLNDLYNHSRTVTIQQTDYRNMFYSAVKKIKEHYVHITLYSGLSRIGWYEILLINMNPKDEKFIQIST